MRHGAKQRGGFILGDVDTGGWMEDGLIEEQGQGDNSGGGLNGRLN